MANADEVAERLTYGQQAAGITDGHKSIYMYVLYRWVYICICVAEESQAT